jgi:hypothetical protein
MTGEDVELMIERMEQQWGDRYARKVRLFLDNGTNVLAYLDRVEGELLHVNTPDRKAVIAVSHIVSIAGVPAPQ